MNVLHKLVKERKGVCSLNEHKRFTFLQQVQSTTNFLTYGVIYFTLLFPRILALTCF